MRDPVTGKYIVTRFMNQTSTLLKGEGDTVEEARKNLKAEVKKYRENNYYLKPVGEIHSPGMAMQQTESGRLSLRFDPQRKRQVLGK
jgi:hypothetical protein